MMELWRIESVISQAITVLVILSSVPLVAVLIVGVIVSVLQAATQIQEQTLSLVPKLVVFGAVLYFLAPFFGNQLTALMTQSLEALR